MAKVIITEEQISSALNKCYGMALGGLPKTQSCYELAEHYMEKYEDPNKAASEFVKWQVAKCSTSGFLTSLGGIITMPVAIPANLTSVIYVQLRMIATIAIIGGYNPSDDEVQSLAFLCLTGASMSKVCREAGIKFSTKLTTSMIKKIPGEALKKINQKVAQRFITKFGTTGIINLGKMVPIVGGVVGAGFDFVGTNVIAKKSRQVFLDGIIE